MTKYEIANLTKLNYSAEILEQVHNHLTALFTGKTAFAMGQLQVKLEKAYTSSLNTHIVGGEYPNDSAAMFVYPTPIFTGHKRTFEVIEPLRFCRPLTFHFNHSQTDIKIDFVPFVCVVVRKIPYLFQLKQFKVVKQNNKTHSYYYNIPELDFNLRVEHDLEVYPIQTVEMSNK